MTHTRWRSIKELAMPLISVKRPSVKRHTSRHDTFGVSAKAMPTMGDMRAAAAITAAIRPAITGASTRDQRCGDNHRHGPDQNDKRHDAAGTRVHPASLGNRFTPAG